MSSMTDLYDACCLVGRPFPFRESNFLYVFLSNSFNYLVTFGDDLCLSVLLKICAGKMLEVV